MSKSKTKQQRDRLVRRIRRNFHEWYEKQPDPKGPPSHYCVWWAVHTTIVLRAAGFDAQLQAGSAFWRAIRPEDDDGVMATDWGYQFEWSENAMQEVLAGDLPEMHAWVGIIYPNDEHEMVDLTTCFFKARCIADGYRWTYSDPPDYLWANVKDPMFRGRCYYKPEKQAIALTYALLEEGRRGRLILPIYKRDEAQ